MRRAGLLALLLLAAASFAAPLYARFVSGTDPFRTNVLGTLGDTQVLAEAPGGLGTVPVGPGWHAAQPGAYLLGADALGRDVAARLLYGGRTSLAVAAAATLLCLALGTLLGTLAGARPGWVDTGLSGLVDLLWAFPATLLAISLSVVWAGEETGPLLPVAILGLVFAPYVARPVRAALVALRATPLVEAARATGCAPARIVLRHMLPQLAPLLAGLAPVVAAAVLLTEAALSVLGIGVSPPGVSWGTLVADGVALLHVRPAVAIAPGLMLSATVLALNAVAEGSRETH